MKYPIISCFSCILVAILMLTAYPITANATTDASSAAAISAPVSLDLDCRSALLMEATTGTVLYESNADEALPPASVTKIMTLLLVMEAVEAGKAHLTDTVTVSAHAASMGGSQVYLKEGEQMSLEELLKCVVIASANDAAVALAEHIAGSEESFVAMMNARAGELGAKSAKFENTNGLDDTATAHHMSARDIALISRELIRYDTVLHYSSTWMDSIRDGAFGLTNTNRLVRFYPGCTGLKTGSTSKAGFCITATAVRDGLSLICVILGSPTRDVRNAAATKLLDYGFATYTTVAFPAKEGSPIKVLGGMKDLLSTHYPAFSAVIQKSERASLRSSVSLSTELCAPVRVGDTVGEIVYYVGDREIGRASIVAEEAIDRITMRELLCRIFRAAVLHLREP